MAEDTSNPYLSVLKPDSDIGHLGYTLPAGTHALAAAKNQQEIDAELAKEQRGGNNLPFSEAWAAGRRLTSTESAHDRLMAQLLGDVDPNFKITQEHWDRIPEEYRGELSRVYSEGSFNRLMDEIAQDKIDARTLADYGNVKGTATAVGAAFTDLPSLALGLLTFELSAGAAAVWKMNRLRKAALIGSVEATTAGATTKFIDTMQHEDGWTNAAWAAAIGFALGGGIGALTRTENEILGRAAHSAVREGEHLATAGRAGQADSVGASAVSGEQTNRLVSGLPIEEDRAPAVAFSKVRADSSATIASAESGTARVLGARLVEEGVGAVDHTARPVAASTRVARWMAVRETDVGREAHPAFGEWFKDQGLPWYKRFDPQVRERFMHEVSDAIEQGAAGANPAVARLAQKISQSFEKTLAHAKEAGVPWADKVIHAGSYLPRIWSPTSLAAAVRKFRATPIHELFATGFLRANPGMEETTARILARKVVDKLRKAEAGIDPAYSRLFSRDSADELGAWLRGEGVDENVVQDVMAAVKPPKEQTQAQRLRSRMMIDMDTEMTMPNGETLRLRDFTERNAERLHRIYTRQLAGHAAMAKAGIPDNATWNKLLAQVKDELAASEHSDARKAYILKSLEFAKKSVTGEPLEADPMGLYSRSVRILRSFNFVRLMNQMGAAQIVDAANMISLGGFRTAMKHLPAFRDVIDGFRHGGRVAMGDDLAREIETMWASGSDMIRRAVSAHAEGFDETAATLGLRKDMLGRVENRLEQAKHVTNVISGFTVVNTVLHRMAGRVVLQKFTDMALGSATPDLKRLAVLGVDADMLDRILVQLKKNVDTEDGVLGRKVKRINLDKWDDAEAADVFQHAGYSWGRRMIQENDPGQMNFWMSNTTGRMLLQFRNFMMVAWSKQTLHSLHMSGIAGGTRNFDPMNTFQMAMQLMLGTIAGSLVYSGRTYVNSIGRSDQEDYLKKRLDPESIIKSGFQQSAWSSIIPATVDTGAMMLGKDDPVFGSKGRTSGLQSGILGVPVVDLVINKAPALGKVLWSGLLPDQQVAKGDMKNVLSLLFWSNAVGIRNVLNAVSADLPSRSKPRWYDSDN